MSDAFGIITSSANHQRVSGLQDFRPMGAFSFAGRYRVIDFPLSNMSNSGIDHIQVYVRENPRSLIEHLSSGSSFNINSKKGKLQVLFSNNNTNDIYNTDVAAFSQNLNIIERIPEKYVVIAPSYLIYVQDFSDLLRQHIASGADITCLYHHVTNAKEKFLNCNVLNLNKQKGVISIDYNRGTAKERNIFMSTYVMAKDIFVELVKRSMAYSSVYTLAQAVGKAAETGEYDIRGIAHHGYFETCSNFKSYFDANLDLLNIEESQALFSKEWPIYTVTTDSAPTRYFETGSAKNSLIANGCTVKGTVENSVIGRSVMIEEGAVIRNCVVLAYAKIGKDVHLENQVVDKWAQIVHTKEIVSTPDNPGYIKREDIL